MFLSDRPKSILRIGISNANVGLLVANVSTRFLVAKIAKRKTFILAAIINIKVAKNVASFLMALNKSLNSNIFCYSYSI